MKEKRKTGSSVEAQREVWKKTILKIGEADVVEGMSETKKKVDLDGKKMRKIRPKEKKKGAPEDGEIAKSVKWTNGDHQEIEMMINAVIEIVIQNVLGHHVGVLKEVDGDVMIEEMIDLHLIEKEDEEIEVADGLMIVSVILNEDHQEGEKVKIVGEGQMKETTEVHNVEIETVQCEEEGMIAVPEMTEAQEGTVVALGVATIVVRGDEMIEAEEMTADHPIGGLDLGNLIETISPKWQIVTAVMIDETAQMVVGTIGDQVQDWPTEIEEALETVAHQQMKSHPVAILQQMERMENGKLSVNVNPSFDLRSSLVSNI